MFRTSLALIDTKAALTQHRFTRRRRRPFAVARVGLSTLLASVLACVGTRASAASLVPATFYDCVGRELTVRYSTAAPTGVPNVVITLGAQVIKARGDNVLIQPSVLGSLVTVRNGSVPDSHSDTLTLLAPDVNVPVIPNKLPTQFLSSFHFTRTFTSVGGPALVQGVIQQSSSQPVICTPSAPSSQATQ
jgi:hypothetical protein